MKIVSITDHNASIITGYVDTGRSYRRFALFSDKERKTLWGKPMPKRDYRNLEHWAGVIGKFDEYAFVLEEPIELKRLDFAELTNLLSKDKRFHQSSGEEKGGDRG